jgi:hypothetical protein
MSNQMNFNHDSVTHNNQNRKPIEHHPPSWEVHAVDSIK